MNYGLYVVTDEIISGGRSHVEIARHAVAGGANVIQLRDKTRSDEDLILIGRAIREITAEAAVVFIVNDRLDVALACRADGVHLGRADLRPAVARRKAPPGFLIGVSVGKVAEARAAEAAGADYVALSPLFSTGSKSDAGPGRGLDVLREVRRSVTLPLIAIGGIDASNLDDVLDAGADGVAVISAVVGQPDIAAAARGLSERIAAHGRQ